MTTIAVAQGAAFNFRDLGGLPTVDGRSIRRGEIFRADGLHRLAERELNRLADTGIRMVVDLRTSGELASGPSVKHPNFEVVHLPVIEKTWTEDPRLLADVDDAVAFLVARYCEMLRDGGRALAAAVEILSAPVRRPAVFHCAAGKDRTGVLAALVLDVLGVPHEIIAADYAASAPAMARLVEWLEAEAPELAEQVGRQPAALLACPPEAMHLFLEHLTGEHGGATAFLLAQGTAIHVLEALRAELLHRPSAG